VQFLGYKSIGKLKNALIFSTLIQLLTDTIIYFLQNPFILYNITCGFR